MKTLDLAEMRELTSAEIEAISGDMDGLEIGVIAVGTGISTGARSVLAPPRMAASAGTFIGAYFLTRYFVRG